MKKSQSKKINTRTKKMKKQSSIIGSIIVIVLVTVIWYLWFSQTAEPDYTVLSRLSIYTRENPELFNTIEEFIEQEWQLWCESEEWINPIKKVELQLSICNAYLAEKQEQVIVFLEEKFPMVPAESIQKNVLWALEKNQNQICILVPACNSDNIILYESKE